jgi:hypothetical protein
MPGEMDLVVHPARIGPAAPSLDRRGDGDLTPWRDSGNHLKTGRGNGGQRRSHEEASRIATEVGIKPQGLAGYFSAGLLNRDTKTGRRCITATGLRTVTPALRRVSRDCCAAHSLMCAYPG